MAGRECPWSTQEDLIVVKDLWTTQRMLPSHPTGPGVQGPELLEMLLNLEQALVLLWLLAFLEVSIVAKDSVMDVLIA